MWLLVGVATLVLAAFPQLLSVVASAFGIQVPSNLLFTMSILLLLGVSLHLSWEISVVEEETRSLAEEVSILRVQVERLNDQVASLSDPPKTRTPAEPNDPEA